MMEMLLMFDAKVAVEGVANMVEVGLLRLGFKVLPRLKVQMLPRLKFKMLNPVWFPSMVS